MTSRQVKRKVDGRIEVSDTVGRKVTRRIIIPLKSTRRELEPDESYFIPVVKEVVKGDYVEWVNLDTRTHHLRFYDVSKYKVVSLFSFEIEPKKSHRAKFAFNISRIDYHCSLHTNEIGTIVTYSTSDQYMNNTDQFRYLSKVFNIKPPDFLSHLGSE
jgi:plastocyanin